MGRLLHHRGPDSRWVVDMSQEAGYRLVSPEACGDSICQIHGAQPMVSHRGRFVLSYNGEIYNHVELKEILDEIVKRYTGGATPTPRCFSLRSNF
jgi:asparagine synthase (glutamine-hydrolysing)